jgi:hypothetical protein
MRLVFISPLIALAVLTGSDCALGFDDPVELTQIPVPTPIPSRDSTPSTRTRPPALAPRASVIPLVGAFPPRSSSPGLATDANPIAGAPRLGLTSLSSFAGGGIPLMLGDLAPMFGPTVNKSSPSAIRVPWARGYKMADNQSPRPQDRFFVAFNFFDDLSQPSGSSLHQVKIYREFFGGEKTFFDGNASIGLRIPLNSISALSYMHGKGGESTALGDLTVYVKQILWQDRTTGSLVSGGLAVTTPTGPSGFAGAHFAQSVTATSLQPFLGYILNRGDWFIQGFTGSNIPTDARVTTMYYNDIGAGYFVYRSTDPEARLTAIVPTLEVHVNTPLSHRLTARAPGTPDVVDLTFGSSFVFGKSAVVSAGVVNPVTGPRPYELEAVALLNIFFGQRRVPPTPPPAF